MTGIKIDIVNEYKIKSSWNEEKSINYETCKKWLKDNLTFKKTINYNFSSYWIKFIVTNEIGAEVTNYDIKCAMCELGIEGESGEGEDDCINYYYPISQKFFKFYNSKN